MFMRERDRDRERERARESIKQKTYLFWFVQWA